LFGKTRLALVIHLSALGAGLAAGLIASCLTRQYVRSFIVAEVLGLLFCIAFSSLLSSFFEMELGELLVLPMGWIKLWGDFPPSLHGLLRVQAGVVCLMFMTLVILVVLKLRAKSMLSGARILLHRFHCDPILGPRSEH
jgi:hypothetical protein